MRSRPHYFIDIFMDAATAAYEVQLGLLGFTAALDERVVCVLGVNRLGLGHREVVVVNDRAVGRTGI